MAVEAMETARELESNERSIVTTSTTLGLTVQ